MANTEGLPQGFELDAASAGIEGMNLTPQEENLYQHHRRELARGGVKNADGSTSTIRQMTVEIGGKAYNLPTVWDGKILDTKAAIARAKQVGLDKFPSYADDQKAQARYDAMHGFMERDIAPSATPQEATSAAPPDGFQMDDQSGGDTELGNTRAALQGVSFGLGDEAVAGLVASARKAAGDERPFSDIYNDVATNERDQIETYRKQKPVQAFLSEGAGALLTGGAAGARLLGAKGIARLPKWLSTAGIGALEGGVYGAGAAKPGERLKEGAKTAAIAGVLTPPLAAVGAVAANLLGDLGKYVAKRLAATPASDAVRIIREAATNAGLKAEDIVKRYQRLGPDGLLLDTDENFRSLMRALSDRFGPAKREARDLLEERQLGQVNRLVDHIEDASGLSADDYVDSMKQLAQKRAATAKPFYDSAFAEAHPSDEMLALAERPGMKTALARAKRLAADEGDPTTDLSFKAFHYAKMALDGKIGKAGRDGDKTAATSLRKLKNALLHEMDDVSPDYKAGRDLYAGDSALLEAADTGRKFYSLSMDEFTDAVSGLSQSEREMFKRGAVKAIVDKLGDSNLTYDNAKKLISTHALQAKLGTLFKSRDAAAKFIEQAAAEREFTRTRNVVTGGSPTSQNLAASSGVEESMSAIPAVLRGDKISAGLAVIGKVFGKKAPSPETIKAATAILLKRDMTPEQITQVFKQSGLAIPKDVLSNALRGSVAPEALTATSAVTK